MQLFANLALIATVVAQTTPYASQESVPASAGSLGLGSQCSDKSQCANGADCYASNSMLMTLCGNTNAVCQTDDQCAFNACKDGFCSGAEKTSSPSASSSASSPSTSSTATPGTVALGSPCSSPTDCANGAQCYASNSMQITVCGNFNAGCQTDGQCAFNLCSNGFCNGALKSSSSSLSPTASAAPASGGSNATGTGNGGASATGKSNGGNSGAGTTSGGSAASGTSSGRTAASTTAAKAGAAGGSDLGFAIAAAALFVWVL